MSDETLFHEARQKPVGERTAFLQEACGGDDALRARLESLLQADDNPDSLLEPKLPATSAISSLSEAPGQALGPYKLLQQIGEGGMGSVFLAQQTKPIKRMVALKIIKASVNSGQVTARFEAERQALALMDHPNIAKMLDAGTTDTGQPYFVMELVKGVPIIQYCDEHRLTPPQRLELFISVCQAIQHAHQKGIIHRDLKPTNILVADYDDQPVAKIIDFGVAKAVGQELTQRTMFTEFGQVLGTIEYMSPEQAKLNQLDIDTRTDIYSLGVLLYELLAGSTPFDKERLRSAAFDEMLRIIREEEPVSPSTRLSTSLSLPSIAANRHLEPKKLTTTVSGDLDWIVMKALEKDRTRRYDTATGLAEDIQRYLSDQPVEARRPTRTYRLKKFVRRNKLAFATVSSIAISLMIGLGASTWMFLEVRQARDRAIDAEQRAKALADKSQQVAIQLGHSLWQLGDALSTSGQRNNAEPIFTEAAKTFDDAARDFPEAPFFRQEQARSEYKIGEFLNLSGRTDQAESHYRTAIREYAALAKDSPEVSYYVLEEAHAYWVLAAALQRAGRHEEAADSYRRAAELHRKMAERGDATAQNRLGAQYLAGTGVAKDPVEALKWFRLAAQQGSPFSQTDMGNMYAHGWGINQDDAEAARWYRLAADQNHPSAQALLGEMYAHGRGVEKNETEAATLFRHAADYYLREGEAGFVGNANELAWQLVTTDVLTLRDPFLAVDLAQKAVGIDPDDGTLWKTLGAAQYRAGNWQAALTALNKSMELRHGGDSSDWLFLAMGHWQLNEKEDAQTWYDKAVEWMDKNEPKNDELVRFRAEAEELLKPRSAADAKAAKPD